MKWNDGILEYWKNGILGKFLFLSFPRRRESKLRPPYQVRGRLCESSKPLNPGFLLSQE